MSWSIEVILRFHEESPRAAINRSMAGGVEMRPTPEGPELRSFFEVDRRASDVVSAKERAWMIAARDALQRFDASLSVTAQDREEGRRRPWSLTLESDDAPLWISIDTDGASMAPVRRRGNADADADWRYWWRCARTFARMGCVVWDPTTTRSSRPRSAMPTDGRDTTGVNTAAALRSGFLSSRG